MSLANPGLRLRFESGPNDECDEKSELLRFGEKHGLIGEAPCFLSFLKDLKRFAAFTNTVLLEGETGTGKELAARALYGAGPGLFLPINCGDMSGEMVRVEIAGYIGGTFTGGDRKDRDGIFVQAKGGIVFLDEVQTLDPDAQRNFLRVLDTGKVRPVAGGEEVDVSDVRIVAASNENLLELSQKHAFRRDLYYRLRVLSIHIPPLRERMSDIPLLVHHFIRKHADRMHSDVTTISKETLEYLKGHDWPGNVRELEHAILYALARKEDESPIEKDELPQLFPKLDPDAALYSALQDHISERPPTLAEAVKATEKITILHALHVCNGNRKEAASLLSVSPNTLRNKMIALDISPEIEYR